MKVKNKNLLDSSLANKDTDLFSRVQSWSFFSRALEERAEVSHDSLISFPKRDTGNIVKGR